MTAAARYNTDRSPGKRIIPYLDLSGGLNTAEDDHALSRNELAASVNCWYPYGKSLGKRPGSVPWITATTGATGSGAACTGLVTARFNGLTYTVVQCGRELYAASTTDTTWAHIGTMGAGAKPIQAAQMFDPGSQKNTLFIVNGVDFPLAWQGPATTIVAASTLTGASLPLNYPSAGAIITPSLVTTYQNFLIYSGEPTMPTAVYVSNPTFPNQFTNPATLTANGSDPNYQPYIVGNNDGVNGGNITGLCALEQGVVIFKEAAIYSFILTAFYNDVIFYPQLISSSTGCTSTRSIARFDGFACFLGIDGAYTTGVASGSTQQISAAVPTYFDSSLTGDVALITNRMTAIGVRHGGRYLIFFSALATAPALQGSGLWFDFTKKDSQGRPTVGEISGMSVAGAAALRGPNDDGNVVWCDSGMDRVGKFGVGFSDPNPGASGFGAPITTMFSGKSDFMSDIFESDALLRAKEITKVWLVVSLGGHTPTITFNGSLTFQFSWVGGLAQIPITALGSVSTNLSGSAGWGANWGTMTWSSGANQIEPYVCIEVDMPGGAKANNVQMSFQESSKNEWVIIGYMVEIKADQPQQGSYVST